MNKELKEIIKLNDKLKQWNKAYYIDNNPIVDDAVYDHELRKLIELEEQYPEIFNDENYISVTRMVGSDLVENSTFEKVTHERPVLSLANAMNLEDLKKYEKDINKYAKNENKDKFVIEPKLDGSHIVLTYDDGKLIKAVTRGNGLVGEDITATIQYVKGIPKTIDYKKHLVVDGEILIKNSDFKEINNELPEDQQYPNSRNLTAGSLRLKNASEAKKRKMTAYLYEAYRPDKPFKTQVEVLNFLKLNHFNVDNEITKQFASIDDAWKYIEKITPKKNEIDIPLDGLVFKLNDRSLYDEIGTTSKVPKYNIAYKFPPIIKQTKVKNIYPTIGRTGKVTYVADLEPVEIEGVIVKSVTLHNYEYIKEKDIQLNDTIELYRSGMVIPKVNKVVLNKRTGKEQKYEMPKNCPCCKEKIVKKDLDLVDYFCLNENCESRLINKLIHFVTKDAMNIEGLSEKTIEKFFKDGYIHELLDLYDLEKYKDEILNKDYKIKDKSWNKLIANIEKSKSNSLEQLIYGLGIKSIGKTIAKKLAKRFKTLEKLASADKEELLKIEDIGDIVVENLIDYFKNNELLIDKIKSKGINTKIIEEQFDINEDNQFFNKKFCITGSFENYNRDELKNIIENQYGGLWTSNVSKNTDILICGDNAGSKLEKANALGVKTFDENQLNELLNNHKPKIKI